MTDTSTAGRRSCYAARARHRQPRGACPVATESHKLARPLEPKRDDPESDWEVRSLEVQLAARVAIDKLDLPPINIRFIRA